MMELANMLNNKTSGYATMVHGRGAIHIALRQLSQTWKLRHYDVIDDVIVWVQDAKNGSREF